MNTLYNNHGFDLSATFNKKSVETFEKKYEIILQKRKSRWDELIGKEEHLKFNAQIKRFVRKGIPDEYRPLIWFELSGASKNYHNNEGRYHTWFTETISEQDKNVITADIPRTFPENARFYNPSHQKSLLPHLERILTAFVAKNPNIGYCQGMNFIAGVILLVMNEDEEKAFWVFDALITEKLKSYFISDMFRIKVDCFVLEELLRIKLPNIYQTLIIDSGANCILICAKWFLCSFVDVLPIHTVLRILDCVLCEGDKILFRTALAIIRLNSNAINKCHSLQEVMPVFSSIYQSDSVLFCHEFLNCMFTMIGSLSQKLVDKLRLDAECHLTKK